MRRLDQGRDAHRGGLPSGLFGALALIAAAEALLFAPRDDLSQMIPASWSVAAKSAAAIAPGCEILCLGDSQVKGGVLPSRLGRPGHNLAVIGGQPAAGHALLEMALKAGARPRAVVLGYYPGLLASDSRINVRQWAELLGPVGCLELCLVSRDARMLGPLLAQSLLPSARRRVEIQDAVKSALLARVSPDREKALAYRARWREHQGAHAMPANPTFVDAEAPPARAPGASADAAGARWKVKAEHRRWLDRLIRLAEARGAAVFWLLPTNSPGLRASRERSGLDAAYARFLRDLRRDHPALIVLDPSPVLRDPARFIDPCHLDGQGASTLSLALGAALDRALAVPPADRPIWARLEPESFAEIADKPEGRGLRR